ncbi:uncharacterized protein LOC110679198 [Aedes aegypti]|uniref:Uncharacterized protein n=1 Tax=Aedes aegypti TaxID=7159 RepID=A0A6I8U828_AEDAE|nr:uncharacterized protein LOC110679198 [Aedes aegypti]
MRLWGCTAMLVFSIVLLLWTESALGQTTEPEYEYEYYYDDETTTLSSEAATSTTTTTTTTTRTTTKRPSTTKRNGNIVFTTKRRNMAQKYQYVRPDVIVNIISDMYGLRGMRINGQPLGYGQRYMGSSGYRGYTSRYSSRYGRPIDYWYTMRSDPYGSAQRRKPSMIDYNDDFNSDYNDYYYDLYSKPKNRAETQRKGSNRAIFNFMLSALNKRRN